MQFFINEILEDSEAIALVRERTDLHDRGRQLAEYMKRTGSRVRIEDEALQLVILAFLADYALERNNSAGIDREITVQTLKDVNVWVENYHTQFGRCGIDRLSWLSNHYLGNLYKLGRLQFILIPSNARIPGGLFAIDTHIPQGEKLDIDRCLESFEKAGTFFKKYYSGFDFQYITCGSWLLDENLERFLPPESNLVRFMKLWDKYPLHEDTPSILERVFGFGFDIKDLDTAPEQTSLQRSLKAYLRGGGKCSAMGGHIRIR